MNEVKQHGFLFKQDMVRANLRDVDPKTHTRRVITFDNSVTFNTKTGKAIKRNEWKYLRWAEATNRVTSYGDDRPQFPYWYVPFREAMVNIYPRVKSGDIIWVRETFASLQGGSYEDMVPLELYSIIRYKADDSLSGCDVSTRGYKYRPSIHMPRWASRTDLLVTAMRSERVQEISGEDAKAEGCPSYIGVTRSGPSMGNDTYTWFARLWDSINEARGFGWDINPPVWVHVYKRVKP